MKFKTPCFVRVENPERRDNLIDWCVNIGYETNTCQLPPLVCYVFTESHFAGRCGTKALLSLPQNSVNCGTDIELFKALAAMNDENDREQWFIDQSGWMYLEDGSYRTRMFLNGIYRKATAEEIIEHFKNSQQ